MLSCHSLQRFADLRWAGFAAQMFIRRTAIPLTKKLYAEHETQPIANVLLAVVVLMSLWLCSVIGRLLFD